MIKHYLRVCLRNMKKRPGFYLMNILGLAVGIAACILITHYVEFNRSYDTHSENHARTYRVLYTRTVQGDVVSFASCSPPVGPMMKDQFPEVEAYARMFRLQGVMFYEDVFFEEENIFYGESDLFELLGIRILRGEGSTCLDQPGEVAISQSTARRYFGDEDPLGKMMSHNQAALFKVTAVYEDFPANTHFDADLFLSLATWEERNPEVVTNGWVNSGFYTYVRLQQGADPEKINQGIADFLDRQFGEAFSQHQMKLIYTLQPLTDIHLTSRLMHELEVNNDKSSINLLAIVSWFILLIAWVNFFNLTTIASLKRMREIGVRKVMGAQRKQLLTQFLTESLVVNVLATLMALLFIEVLTGAFLDFAGLPHQGSIFAQSWFFPLLGIAFLVGTLSAGLYSATGISGTNLVSILKGTPTRLGGKAHMRKVLVTFQFIIAIALIAATTGVYSQYLYMLNRDLGFQLDGMLVVKAPTVGGREVVSKFTAFRNEVAQVGGVQDAAFSSIIPGKSNMFNRGGFYRKGDPNPTSKNMRVTEADDRFFSTYGITFLEGEGFTGNQAIDRGRVVLNLNAALLLGFEDARDAVGGTMVLGQREFLISGVIVDFFQLSPKEVIEPQAFWQPERFQGYFTINYGNQKPQDILSQIKPLYESFFPANPFDYFFLDEYYNAQFRHDQRFGTVFALFSMMVVLVTIIGLVGLSVYTAEQRKKEIGIRKILGASNQRLFMMLFRDYVWLWLVAALVAVPLVWHFLDRWLNGFAVRMQVSPWLFVVPLLSVLVISLITVWSMSRRIVSLNPVENIKYE